MKNNPAVIRELHEKSTAYSLATVVNSHMPVRPTVVESSIDFIKIIFDLGYFAGTIPCHIKYDKTRRDFLIRRNKLQVVSRIYVFHTHIKTQYVIQCFPFPTRHIINK